MKIVVFGVQHRVGLWDGDEIIDINNAAIDYFSAEMGRPEAIAKADHEAPADLTRFIAAGKPALDLARRAAERVKGSSDGSLTLPVDRVKLHAPWPAGGRIFCAGANYADHVVALLGNMGQPTTAAAVVEDSRKYDPIGFSKTLIEVAGPDGDVIYPSRSTQFDFEAEIAVVLGRRGTGVSAADAESYIWGITMANDWSDRSAVHPRIPLSFNLNKNFDGGLSLGPWILVGEGDPDDTDVSIDVNGEQRQSYNTRDMIFSFAEYIVHLSHDMTLAPGDLILGGTPDGTAMDQTKRGPDGKFVNLDLFLKPGDVVEMKSPTLGNLKNTIVARP